MPARKLDREAWLDLAKRGLTLVEAAREAGTTRGGAWRAADRHGFSWKIDATTLSRPRRPRRPYFRPSLAGLSEAQKEAYRLARKKRFRAIEAYEMALRHKENHHDH